MFETLGEKAEEKAMVQFLERFYGLSISCKVQEFRISDWRGRTHIYSKF